MRTYLLKRILLIFPTLFGISIACFLVMQAIPGGPVEQMMQNMRSALQNRAGGGGAVGLSVNALTAEELKNIRHIYGFDRPVLERYLPGLASWLQVISHFLHI